MGGSGSRSRMVATRNANGFDGAPTTHWLYKVVRSQILPMSISNQNSRSSEVARFVSKMVYFLVFNCTADHLHPTVLEFESFIANVLKCSSNNVNISVLLTSLLYVSRYVQAAPQGTANNALNIWTVALILSDVYHNDCAYTVQSWSQVTMIPLPSLIQMRKQFLETISYNLDITLEDYNIWTSKLQVMSNYVSIATQYQQQRAKLQMEQSYHHQQMGYQSLMRNGNISVGYISPQANMVHYQPAKSPSYFEYPKVYHRQPTPPTESKVSVPFLRQPAVQPLMVSRNFYY